jgi:hypothetical protein
VPIFGSDSSIARARPKDDTAKGTPRSIFGSNPFSFRSDPPHKAASPVPVFGSASFDFGSVLHKPATPEFKLCPGPFGFESDPPKPRSDAIPAAKPVKNEDGGRFKFGSGSGGVFVGPKSTQPSR